MTILEQLEHDLHDAARRCLATPSTRATTREPERAKPRSRVPRRSRALAALPLLAAAIVALVLLSSGASNPTLNVAAAAYAATTAPSGVVESTFLTRVYRGAGAGEAFHQRQWLQGATGRRRELNALSDPTSQSDPYEVNDWVFAPRRWENWSAGTHANVIHRVLLRAHAPDLKVHFAFGGIGIYGAEGIALYRRLYRAGAIRLVGKQGYQGRQLWKLENHSAELERASHTRFVVLVDPHNFLPILVRQLDIRLPTHPTIVESAMLSYRVLPNGAAGEKLFDLAAQHPAARVLTRTSSGPHFRTQHRPARRR
ncbi:MAG: hypothetical protein ACRDK4_01090 [Solirubrobacteraceae bacterium]